MHIKECVNNTLTTIPWQSEDRPSDDSALPHNGEDLRILDWAAQVPRSCETGYVVNRFISKMGELICGTPPPPSLPLLPSLSPTYIRPLSLPTTPALCDRCPWCCRPRYCLPSRKIGPSLSPQWGCLCSSCTTSFSNEGGDSNNPSSSTQSHNPEQSRGRSVTRRNEPRGKSLGRAPSVQRPDQRRKTPSRGRRASSQEPQPREPSANSKHSAPSKRSLSRYVTSSPS